MKVTYEKCAHFVSFQRCPSMCNRIHNENGSSCLFAPWKFVDFTQRPRSDCRRSRKIQAILISGKVSIFVFTGLVGLRIPPHHRAPPPPRKIITLLLQISRLRSWRTQRGSQGQGTMPPNRRVSGFLLRKNGFVGTYGLLYSVVVSTAEVFCGPQIFHKNVPSEILCPLPNVKCWLRA